MTNASVQVAVEDAILEQLLTSGCSTLMLRDMFSVALDEQMTSVRPLHRLLYSRSNASVYFRLQNRFNGGCFHPLVERGVGTDPAPHTMPMYRQCVLIGTACIVCAIGSTALAKKRGHRLMTIILSDLNRFKKNSLEDSLVNLQINGC